MNIFSTSIWNIGKNNEHVSTETSYEILLEKSVDKVQSDLIWTFIQCKIIFCSRMIYYLLYKYERYQIMYITLAKNIRKKLFLGLLLCLIPNNINIIINCHENISFTPVHF
jgi:hypothetical protein